MSSPNKSKRAVALKYNPANNNAPVVVASGNGYVASKVIEVAEKNGVPIYRDDSLAILLSQLDLGTEIPDELFSTIVDIYAYFINFNPDKKRKEEEAEKTKKADEKMNIKESEGEIKDGQE